MNLEKSLKENVDEAVRKLIEEHSLAVENLTKEQFTEAVKQAVECGDFSRMINVDKKSQKVTYIPHRDKAKLEMENRRICKILEEIKTLTYYGRY